MTIKLSFENFQQLRILQKSENLKTQEGRAALRFVYVCVCVRVCVYVCVYVCVRVHVRACVCGGGWGGVSVCYSFICVTD